MSSTYLLQIHVQEKKAFSLKKVLVIIDGQITEVWLLVPNTSRPLDKPLMN